MMDTAARVNPADASGIVTVDHSIMSLCNTSVLVNSVTVRHLPANVSDLTCAITLTVNGTSFTMPAIKAEEESQEVDEVTGTVPFITFDGNEVNSRGVKCGVFKMRYDNLGLLFPGNRMRAREMGSAAKMCIENPRHFPRGVQVTVHSADHNHVFGSTLCTCSGEAMSLSYPRGEAVVNFRVYPVINGEAEMTPLFNKSCFLNTYLGPNAARLQPNAITAGPAAGEEGEAALNAAGEVVEGETEAAEGEDAAAAAPEEEEEDFAAAECVAAADEEAVAEAAAEQPEAEAESPNDDIVATAEEEEEERAVVVAVVPPRVPVDWSSYVQVPCYTELERQAAFSVFDKGGKGFLTHGEFLAFCKSHCAYADVWDSDDQMLRSLVPDLRADQEVSYALFSYVCLKLAAS